MNTNEKDIKFILPLSLLGGRDNIVKVNNCATRLRLEVKNADKVNIEDALDGQDLPYVNLGVEYPDVSTDSGEVTLTAYNYSEEIIANIKEAYQNKGWTLYETYVLINGKAIKTVGGYLIANGHTYILTVTPDISEAMYGDGHFSSSSVSTEIKIEMA